MSTQPLRRVGSVVVCGYLGGTVAVGPVLAAGEPGSGTGGLILATSELAQVILSIAAVSFAVLAARAYGGEIGKALYVAGGGVIIFGTWQLLSAGSQLLNLRDPPVAVGSTVNLVVTILLMAGFYLLYETVSSHV